MFSNKKIIDEMNLKLNELILENKRLGSLLADVTKLENTVYGFSVRHFLAIPTNGLEARTGIAEKRLFKAEKVIELLIKHMGFRVNDVEAGYELKKRKPNDT